MSIQYLQRATFTIKKEVGGRELTKLWVYGLVLPSQLRFPPNVFFPNFVRGGNGPKFGSMCNDGVSILFVLHMTKESQTCECVNMKYVQQISPFCFARKSPSEPPAFSQKKQCEHSCILAISLVAAYEMFEHIDMYICYYIFRYIYVMYI